MDEAGEWVDTEINDEMWIGVGDAAREARVDPSTVRRWADAGKVRARVTPGGTLQIALSSLRSGFDRETVARRRGGSGRKTRSTLGPDPLVEHAATDRVILYLGAASEHWGEWKPRHLSVGRLEQLRKVALDLQDALADIIDVVTDEIRDRDDERGGW